MVDKLEGELASAHSIHSKAEGASIIQVELGLGRNAAILLWLSTFVSALAMIGLFFIWSHYDRAYDDMGADIAVMQYDFAQMRASLVEKGIHEPTGH